MTERICITRPRLLSSDRNGLQYHVQKTHLPGYLYVGLRYGMTSFSYDVDGPAMTDPNYGGLIEVPYSYHGQKSNASWLEGLVGIKVKIYKSFCMGWSVRYKMRMSVKNHENSEPWYIPVSERMRKQLQPDVSPNL